MAEIKMDVRISEMDKDMVKSVVDITTEAMQKYNVDRDIASHIKHEFDRKYGVLWHCVVGKDYGRDQLFR
ncbi:dynein light chain type 1 [Opisthorchis viverrini]|uniref:Dynein light chain n=1 Tax=Opisthorchis viverrini TaxID=6198 RepID=A0A1S8X1Q5_OPIVI|nr:dynein light chain type 1 [Opisthorchis viverrini]